MVAELRRILLVDDDPSFRALARHLLERAGYSVEEAADGSQGLRQLRQNMADVLVVDIVMPELEGIETLRLVKKQFPLVKVLVVSGATSALQYLDLARRLGADAVLDKFDLVPDLVAAVRELSGT
jgi:CheY-like chemotaxis protein